MSSAVQKNLEAKNAEYSQAFNKGDLALPPGKLFPSPVQDAKQYPEGLFVNFNLR